MTRDAGTGRLGLLGGTFDPIHTGHLEAARAAQQALDLAAVLLMPARVPPHRQQGPSASMFHRFAMAALAAQGDDSLMVSDEELCAEGPSYTALRRNRDLAPLPGRPRARAFRGDHPAGNDRGFHGGAAAGAAGSDACAG
jgi:nicotinate-nucleotide adenylyltransferase